MENKYALREEMLERNPQLKKRWWTRVLAGPVIMGARMDTTDWRRFRYGYYIGPLIIAIFGYEFMFGEDVSLLEDILTALFLTFLIAGFPLLHAAAYGYKHRHELDTTGGVTPDFRFMARYGLWWAMIGVGVSTGTGIFQWFKME